MHGLRAEYQDRINFVILDFDVEAERDLARQLGVGRHPAFAVVTAGADDVAATHFGPQPEARLRDILGAAIAAAGG